MKKKIYEYLRKFLSDETKYIIFSVYTSIFKLIYTVFRLFPIKKNKICIRNYDGKGYGDSLKYVVESIKKSVNSDELEIIWLVKKKKCNDNYVTFVNINSLKAFYHMASSKIWLSNNRIPIYYKKKKSQKYIQLWHGGIGMKKIERQVENSLSRNYIKTAVNDSRNIDYLISNSKYRTDLYKKYFWYTGIILEIGSPRNDLLVINDSTKKISIMNKLGIKNDCKVLIYAPTFRRNHKLSYYDIDYEMLLNTLQQKFKSNWKILLRLHPIISDYSDEIIKYNKNLIDVSCYADIYELLPFCDAMISDYSSIMFDFMLIKKPIFIYATDIDEYKRDRDFNISLDSLPFSISKNNIELKENILNFKQDFFSNNVMKFSKQYGLNETGKASEYIKDLILADIKK